MFLHHFVCSVDFPTVQKNTGFETIPHLYWKNDKGVKPANGFQPAFSGHSVPSLNLKPLKIARSKMDHQGNRGIALWHKFFFFF